MKKFFLPLSCLLVGCMVQGQSSLTTAIDSVLQTYSGSEKLNGVVLVANKGRIQYERALGYREYAGKIKLKTTDIFELASVSKQFTAMIIMLLKEKGLLQYDDAVEKYLNIPYKGISIRHLLTHTSGLPDYQAIMDEHWDKSAVAGNEDILEYLNRYRPAKLFEPGEKYRYSNTGYILLASIAEKVSGKDFIAMCRESIFRPLKMKHTAIRTGAEKAAIKNFAIGHIRVDAMNEFIRADSFPSSNYTIWLGNRKGPGRISSTAADLLKWDQALYGEKLISQQSLQEAFTPMKLNDGKVSDYGFGWVIMPVSDAGKIVWHNGDNPGYKTLIMRLLEKNKTLILLCNNATEKFDAITKQLRTLLTQ
ncbi:MAG: hypothetical protein RLZZ28_1287 [Bacteroidota bacterium]|jgi:CubicO group peptidase (beta-lactamase class C family)